MAKNIQVLWCNIWKLLPNDVKNRTTTDNSKLLLKAWEQPKCQCQCNALKYSWTFLYIL